MNYRTVRLLPGRELVAIFKAGDGILYSEHFQTVTKAIGTHNWHSPKITKAEFETYQAFGIREINI